MSALRRIWLIASFALVACASVPVAAPTSAPTPTSIEYLSDEISLAEGVLVQPLRPGVWRHVSYHDFPAIGPVPSNGVIVSSPEGALLIDTAWDSQQTSLILDWIEQNVGRVNALLVTHSHIDRVGGLSEVQRRGIPSLALRATVDLVASSGDYTIQHAVESGFQLDRYGVRGELFFPGSGHSPDNAVVYVQDMRMLAGTCMVRSVGARTLGNIADADLTSWPIAIRRIQERYPQVELVVPGHGAAGGPELLRHTLDLLADSAG